MTHTLTFKVSPKTSRSVVHQEQLLQTLAEFRFQLRHFLQFSEGAAHAAGLQPQQHQLLLQIAGAAANSVISVGYLAERLGVKHNSAVELTSRCEAAGLIERTRDTKDSRRMVLALTAKGLAVIAALSENHGRELYVMAPILIRSLEHIRKVSRFQIAEQLKRGKLVQS